MPPDSPSASITTPSVVFFGKRFNVNFVPDERCDWGPVGDTRDLVERMTSSIPHLCLDCHRPFTMNRKRS